MTRTFIDSGVLIAAARGKDDVGSRAMAILADPDREFASSIFVRLEVLPKAVFHNQGLEVEFYEAFFEAVSYWAEPVDQIAEGAYQQATRLGLSAMDALHVAAALHVGATEIVTTEGFQKPIHRATDIKITSI
ncbi:MAG: type II toxin-antitoxin system VapC family toxin [Anaerolineae bacterium]